MAMAFARIGLVREGRRRGGSGWARRSRSRQPAPAPRHLGGDSRRRAWPKRWWRSLRRWRGRGPRRRRWRRAWGSLHGDRRDRRWARGFRWVVLGVATLVRPQCLALAPLLGVVAPVGGGERTAWKTREAQAGGDGDVGRVRRGPRNVSDAKLVRPRHVNGGWNLLIGAQTTSGAGNPSTCWRRSHRQRGAKDVPGRAGARRSSPRRARGSRACRRRWASRSTISARRRGTCTWRTAR